MTLDLSVASLSVFASRWFEGACEIQTYELDELLGTKLRALYQRKQARDLFDLEIALTRLPVDPRRALIDRAAEAVGKNRSEFMLDAATREATTVLLDRRFFQLDARASERFAAALDAAPSDNPRLADS